MTTAAQLEKFQGPLGLLLQLIDDQKLAITEIALAHVTEQFLKQLDTIPDNRSEELADFLLVATRLVYLKSRALLPYLNPEEPEGPSLADQLKLYKRYADASLDIEKLWNRAAVAYGRVEPLKIPDSFKLPLNAGIQNLQAAMNVVINRLRPLSPLPEVSIDRSISVRQKIESIYGLIKKWAKLSFARLLGRPGNKTEVIVSFLALLELAKQEKISVEQAAAFGELMIKKV